MTATASRTRITHVVVALTIAIGSLSSSAPAMADHVAEPHAELRTERVYFHCADHERRHQNLARTLGNIPSWDTTLPEGSWSEDSDAGGCTYLEDSVDEFIPVAGREAIWEGTFTGNLRHLTILAHRFPTNRESEVGKIRVLVVVDGQRCRFDLVRWGDRPREIDEVEITISHLPFVTELGQGTTTRDVRVELSASQDLGSTRTLGSEWAFDAQDTPSGLLFNTDDEAAIDNGFPAWKHSVCFG